MSAEQAKCATGTGLSCAACGRQHSRHIQSPFNLQSLFHAVCFGPVQLTLSCLAAPAVAVLCSVADLTALSNLQSVKLNLVVSSMNGITSLRGLSK